MKECQDEVYCAYIDKFKHSQNDLEKLFEHFAKYNVFIRPKVQDLLLENFIYGSAVTDRRGLCYNCKERLPPTNFSKKVRLCIIGWSLW